MKKNSTLLLLGLFQTFFAQFNLKMELKNSKQNEAYIFGYNGSRDFLLTKATNSTNHWDIKIPKEYKGIMRVYFPSNSDSFTCISENKNVVLIADSNPQKKFINLEFKDAYNQSFVQLQSFETRKKQVLPVLQSMKSFYPNPDEAFRKAIDLEILALSQPSKVLPDATFTKFYYRIQNDYLKEKASSSNPDAKPLQAKIKNLIINSDDLLETSSLLRPLLVQYLGFSTNTSLELDVDQLIKSANLETSRGQNVMSEMLEIFQAYEIHELQQKYINEAKALTCTINDRLSSTIKKTDNFNLGALLPDYVFKLTKNKNLKSIHNIKAKYKIVLFWASTCSHCMAEIPEIIKNYNELKSKGAEIIGVSLDTSQESYDNTVKNLSWINDTELKGWYSSFMNQYNIVATPTMLILDENNKIIAKPSKFTEVINYFKDK